MYRVEDKYVCSKNELYLLQKRLEAMLPSDSNQVKEEGYTISSVYFDDLYDSDLCDTVDGVRERKKYRIQNNRKYIWTKKYIIRSNYGKIFWKD